MTDSEPFDDLEYTRAKIRRQLDVIQEHASDGSAFQNCRCIQEKHLDLLAEYSSEGVAIAKNPKEKAFYTWLAPWSDYTLKNVKATLDKNDDKTELEMWKTLADDAREIRKEVVSGTFTTPNPASTRAYLPHGLTTEEKQSPHLTRKLSSCIRHVEKRMCPTNFQSYEECEGNPVAICRASVEK